MKTKLALILTCLLSLNAHALIDLRPWAGDYLNTRGTDCSPSAEVSFYDGNAPVSGPYHYIYLGDKNHSFGMVIEAYHIGAGPKASCEFAELRGCADETTLTEGTIPGTVIQKVSKTIAGKKIELRATEFNFTDNNGSKRFSIKSQGYTKPTVNCEFTQK